MENKISELKREIAKVIVGREKDIELLTIALIQGGHILLESVPGTGKTLLAKTFAKCINGDFKRIQFTPDVLPTDVTGMQFFNPKNQQFELRQGPIITNILLADEINRATPRTQSSLLEVMEERQVTIDGETLKVEEPFMVIATQNQVESQQGTFPLPAAQLDRFFMKISIEYPTYEEERDILRKFQKEEPLSTVQAILSKEELIYLKQEVKNILISEDVEKFILLITRQTREHSAIDQGASPRAALALLKASQGHAFIQGRQFVTPDDVKIVAPYVLKHRLYLSMEASLTNTVDEIFEDIVSNIPAPVESVR
ncbi:AAA family ATPase [Heyndrickxia vini]|uniref:MoxR family ATPase n=1 Tax=Heyndrickxia vini TaxID=1476025 RepID=A0ABX7DYV9_9BACI|nr:MoxR family ATPase [Heyndrickxia vini]QQZ08129.1 MoxR family ATPase [Heyndrickxia vini]